MNDEPFIRDMTAQMLKPLDQRVSLAEDCREAVDLYHEDLKQQDPFDLVIMDLTVPGGKGGIWAMDRLRQVDPRVRSLVVSGYGNDEALADFTAHGFKGRLMKPFRLKDLREIIQEAMRD